MAQRVIFSTLMAAIAVASSIGAARADDAAPIGQRTFLGEVTQGPVQHPCELPNCATVLSVQHRESWESPAPISARGLGRNPPFDSYNPRVAPVTQPSSSAQQRKEAWIIEVRRRDGAVQEFRQSYPALFQVGDEVLVEGDRIRVSD